MHTHAYINTCTYTNTHTPQVGRTFLQVKLSLNTGRGRLEENVMELTLEQFYDFIQVYMYIYTWFIYIFVHGL